MTFDEYINSIGISFNEQQLNAIKRVNGATLLLAVPGSGKTTTIIARLGYMINCLNIDPHKILTLTYTRAATMSMKNRYEQLFGETTNVEFRTIHGVCAKILIEFEKRTGRTIFKLCDNDGDITKIIRKLFTDMTHEFPTEAEIKDLKAHLAYHRNMMSEMAEIEAFKLDYINYSEFYSNYKKYKITHHIMDHDDQLEYAYTVLKTHSDILEFFHSKYTYINVDEAQDTSKIQHEIIKLLANENIFMVGDEDQSIYSFRAAYPESLFEFSDTFENASVMLMETNYRSSKQIVVYADRFIKANKKRFDKSMLASIGSGLPPKLVELHDFSNAYTYLLSLLRSTDTQTAVLYRNNESVLPLVSLFNKNNVPFSMQGNDAVFFSTRTVSGLLDILKFVLSPNSDELFMKIYYRFNAGISKEMAINTVKAHKKTPNAGLIDTLINLGADAKSYSRLRRLPEQLIECKALPSEKALSYIAYNLMLGYPFHKQSPDLQKLNILLSLAIQYPDKVSFINRCSELCDICKSSSISNSSCAITFSTIHSSKGLEYDRVIILDAREGVLPTLSSKELSDESKSDILEEERRIFYVAATRAKRELIVFTSNRYNRGICERSLFIDEFFGTTSLCSTQDKVTTKAKPPKSVQKPVKHEKFSIAEQAKLKERLIVGAIIEHSTFGKCRIASNDGRIIRVVVVSSGVVKPLDIDLVVKKGLLTIL